jgi:TonB family protein
MIRSFGMFAFFAMMFVASGKVLAQTDTSYSSEPVEIVPLDDLIRYPEKAKENGIEGDVILDADVMANGSISEVEIIRSDDSLLNNEAMRVLKTTRFEPAKSNGKPRSAWIIRTLHFRIPQPAFPMPKRDVPPHIPSDQDGPCPMVGNEPQPVSPLEKLIHYPEEARKNGIEGKVTLQALINRDGSVAKVELLKTTDSIFDEEAIRVMKSARFIPAEQNGTPLKIWITRTINFRLKDNAN